ncbi:MAG TPA: AAA family ATPase [Kiritimatiellia bacterium]|nr:AAA family ATPase [Kiritimatiellia bacterium]
MKSVESMIAETETTQADTPEGAEIVRPYSTRAWDELGRMHLVPPLEVWGGFTLGASCVIFGQGGLGKSRLALNIARNQVLGLPFAGLPTAPRPLRHLMMGSENSIHRLQYDIRKMNAGLTAEQVAMLGAHIRMATLEGPEDTYISMTVTNAARWQATLEAWPPDVLWVDPWGDVLEGEANSDEDARATISNLRRLLRKVKPEAGLCILAHSRTGASNILQAVGFDSANFGKGSKALYSAARCVWNLAPGSESEDPPLVCAHAKCNDKPKEKPFAIRLDPESMTYNREDGFDLEAWQAELSARARGRSGPKRGPTMTEEQAFEALGDKVVTITEVRQLLRGKGATRDEADDLTKRLAIDGRWEQWRPAMRHTPTYIGPPAAMQRKKTEVAELLQRKLDLGQLPRLPGSRRKSS